MSALLASLLAVQIAIAPAQNPLRIHQLKDLEKAKISIGTKNVVVWVMDTPGKRTEGMMYLKPSEVGAYQGMIFVFSAAQEMGFWNQNVQFPLDIAFIDEKGMVIHTATMKANDPTNTPSNGPSKYVLEMKQGAFKKIGVKKGTQIKIPAILKGS